MNTVSAPEHGQSHNPPKENPAIDEGMRRWYDAYPCCLSEAYPAIKETLDIERNVRTAESQTIQPTSKDGQEAELSAPEPEEDWGIGGEPACWAHLVCPECGAITTEGHRRGCSLWSDTV